MCVTSRRFNEHIESAFRLDAIVSDCHQAFVHRSTIEVVRGEVGFDVGAEPDDLLYQRRRADVSERSRRAGDGVTDVASCIGFRVDERVADALSRHGECLAVRVADDCIFVDFRYERCDQAVIDEFAIRLVGDDIDGATDVTRFFVEEVGERFEFFRLVDAPCRVVGRVQNDSSRRRREGVLDSLKRNAEIGQLRRDDDELRALSFDVAYVLGKIRGQGDELISLARD